MGINQRPDARLSPRSQQMIEEERSKRILIVEGTSKGPLVEGICVCGRVIDGF